MYMSEIDALSPLFRLPGVKESAEKAYLMGVRKTISALNMLVCT